MKLTIDDPRSLIPQDVTIDGMKQFEYTDNAGTRYVFKALKGGHGLQLEVLPYGGNDMVILPTGRNRIEIGVV